MAGRLVTTMYINYTFKKILYSELKWCWSHTSWSWSTPPEYNVDAPFTTRIIAQNDRTSVWNNFHIQCKHCFCYLLCIYVQKPYTKYKYWIFSGACKWWKTSKNHETPITKLNQSAQVCRDNLDALNCSIFTSCLSCMISSFFFSS